MKVKTSVTLSEDLLKAIDEATGPHQTRSEFVETVVRAYLAHKARELQDANDLEIINRRADALNDEAEDTLAYNAGPDQAV